LDHQERFMQKLWFSALFSLLALAAVALSCGGDPNRQLQSISLSPASADAQNYANLQVQFIATGNYNTSPRMVAPMSATWGACYQNASTDAVTVTSQGLAQCASGATGTYEIWAYDLPSGPNCTALTACGGGCTVVGSAQLTCP
jgi:hypothetical protein